MTDTIIVAQTPSNDATDGSSTRSVGQRFQTSATGKVVSSGRAWVPATGLGTTALWQLWDTTGPTKVAEVDLAALPTPTPSAWMDVPLASSVALTQSHNYIVTHFMNGAANYVWKTSETYPTGSGGTVTSDVCIFRNNGTSSQAPNDTTFTGGLFFVDVNVTDAAIVVNVGTASEVDTAQSIAPTFVVPVGTSNEVDSAGTVGPTFTVPVGTASEVDQALSMAAKFTVNVGTANEVDQALTIGVAGGVVVATGNDLTLTYYANQLAGTLVRGVPTLTWNAALVLWASENPDISVVEALNKEAGLSLPNWLAIVGVLNELADTTDLSSQGAVEDLANP